MGLNLNLSTNIAKTIENKLPFIGDLNIYASGRSELTMVDQIGSNDIDILTATYRGKNNIWRKTVGGALERIFDGNSYTIYFKFNAIDALAAASVQVLQMGNNLGTRRGISLYGSSGKLILGAGDGSTASNSDLIATYDATLLTAGWVECFLEMDKPLNRLRCSIIKYSDDSVLGTPANVDVSTWTFNDDDNYSSMHIYNNICGYADLKKFSGLKTLSQCRDNTYITGLQFHFPTLYDGTDVSTNTYHCIEYGAEPNVDNKFFSNISTYCLDYGYSLYRTPNKHLNPTNSRYFDICVPNTPAGVSIARTLKDPSVVNFVKIEDHEGNLNYHNLYDSKLNIPISTWDRSSTTIYEDAARTSLYYDVSNPNAWHISELDYLLFSFNCKAGYEGLNFFKFDDNSFANRNIIISVFSYATNKINSYLNKILKYTKDYQAMAAAIQLYCDASVLAAIDFKLAGFTGEDSFHIYWGDGLKQDIFTMDGNLKTISKTYGGVENYHIYIFNAPNIQQIKFDKIAANIELAPLNANIGEFAKATSLEVLDLYLNDTTWAGSINNLSKVLKTLKIDRTMLTTITGDVTPFTALEWFEMYASVSGNLSNALNLTNVWFDGAMTCIIDITNLTKIQYLASYADNTLGYGSVENKPDLVHICWGTPNNFTGSISGYANFEYLDNWGTPELSSAITGDVSTLPSLWCFRSRDCNNAFTGSLAANTILELFKVYNDSSNLTKLTTIVNKPLLCQFRADWEFLSAEVNQILADVVTNKDAAKGFPTNRYIYLAYGASEAPTGQGIVDKAFLQAYSSPTPPGTAVFWIIETN